MYIQSNRNSAAQILQTNFIYLTDTTEISIQLYSDPSLFINCGGRRVVIDKTTYKDDSSQIGTSFFALSDDGKWAYSNTGDFVGNENADYIARNTSKLTMAHPELYTEARLSPLSLKYYGLCMENGEYMVKLHFAEIVFTENHTYSSNGKRVFDVFIQVLYLISIFYLPQITTSLASKLQYHFSSLLSILTWVGFLRITRCNTVSLTK